MDWITSYWELISTLAVLLVALINSITPHFGGTSGFVKVLLVVTEYLSFLTSKDSPLYLKPPLTSRPPVYPPSGKLPMSCLLFLLLPLSCASWQATTKNSLDSAGITANTINEVAFEHYKAKCEGIARACAKANDMACAPLVECQEDRHKILTTIAAIHVARIAGYGALAIDKKDEAIGKTQKALQLVGDLFKALTVGGIL